MDAKQWNETHAIGTRVQVTLANGKVIAGRTLGPAQRWGGLDHVQVTGTSGFVLLSWVGAVAGDMPDLTAQGAPEAAGIERRAG
jgi:hypothetical protein